MVFISVCNGFLSIVLFGLGGVCIVTTSFSNSTLIFLWGATCPHSLRWCGLGVFPSSFLAKSSQVRLGPCQGEGCTTSVTVSGWTKESQPRNFCWNYRKGNTSFPTGIARLMEGKCGSSAPGRDILPEKEGNTEDSPGRQSENHPS